jgi:hypothetical protein
MGAQTGCAVPLMGVEATAAIVWLFVQRLQGLWCRWCSMHGAQVAAVLEVCEVG